jgi:hypothetical protein
MDVVRHQHIGMNVDPITSTGIRQDLEVESEIVVSEETGSTIVSTLHDVARHAGQVHPRLARHSDLLSLKCPSWTESSV